MISRAVALFALLFAVFATSFAHQQRRMDAMPSGEYPFYQDRSYTYTPTLSLYRTFQNRPVRVVVLA
ncbi:hypothetical protein GCK32_009827 [Trichostrongylus colubriformis]|uniref:Uncharacterized protein n=1 Tax=Trichostrongylus colubriformis TaxID=6319 RepID=A0AAN8FEI3_TRICO